MSCSGLVRMRACGCFTGVNVTAADTVFLVFPVVLRTMALLLFPVSCHTQERRVPRGGILGPHGNMGTPETAREVSGSVFTHMFFRCARSIYISVSVSSYVNYIWCSLKLGSDLTP